MKACSDTGGHEVGPDAAFGDDEHVDGVGEEPVFEAIEGGGILGATEGEEDLVVAGGEVDLGVVDGDEFGGEA